MWAPQTAARYGKYNSLNLLSKQQWGTIAILNWILSIFFFFLYCINPQIFFKIIFLLFLSSQRKTRSYSLFWPKRRFRGNCCEWRKEVTWNNVDSPFNYKIKLLKYLPRSEDSYYRRCNPVGGSEYHIDDRQTKCVLIQLAAVNTI